MEAEKNVKEEQAVELTDQETGQAAGGIFLSLQMEGAQRVLLSEKKEPGSQTKGAGTDSPSAQPRCIF